MAILLAAKQKRCYKSGHDKRVMKMGSVVQIEITSWPSAGNTNL